ncbi:MAG: septation protein SpoVG family protein [Ignavibacteria bacterium]|nr:septation protein SpoVG family protein [Ignavibacteria bacterium]
MKIVRINPLHNSNGSKTVAFLDIQTEEGIVIKGFRLVNGSNGLFLSAPNEKGKDGKYYDSVVIPKEMKEELQKNAIDEYNANN